MKIFDIHTHGFGGYHTKTESADEILKIAEFQGSHGVSDIIPTIYPAPIELMRQNMDAVKKAMGIQMHAKGKAAMINGVYLEGPFLNPLQCGALDASSFQKPDKNLLKQLVDGFEDVIRIITVAPELDGSIGLIQNISDMGIIVSMGHSDATYSEAEAGYNAGARGITHLFNAMRGIHHREPGIAGFGLMNKDMYIEIIADPFHLDLRTVDFIFNTKSSDKIIVISDSVKDSRTDAPSEGIRNEHSRLIGGSMAVTESVNFLISRGVNKERAMKAISENPEQYLQRT